MYVAHLNNFPATVVGVFGFEKFLTDLPKIYGIYGRENIAINSCWSHYFQQRS
jgi:hypothetical protein